jgi:hypothetical protein
MINVHNADHYVGSLATVKHNYSFLSHFRENIDKVYKETKSKRTLSIRFIYIDVEYYHFLLRNDDEFRCNMSMN